MQILPFEDLNRIKAQLGGELLSRLIAVFSKRRNDDLLLVYLPGSAPEAGTPHLLNITLDKLAHWDLNAYDGPIIAFSAIDVIRPDLPTKGTNFFMLDHLLLERRLVAELHGTSAELSRYLLGLLHSAHWQPASDLHRQRAIYKIISLALPSLLAKAPRQNLLAVLPDRDLRSYLEDGACRLIYRRLPSATPAFPKAELHLAQDLEAPDFVSRDDKIIALEEVWPAKLKEDDALFPLELRIVLRESGLDDFLYETITALALDFYNEWEEQPDRAALFQMANALALEKWLANTDVDDLVAVLPADNFEKFATIGAGTYVYSRLPESVEQFTENGIRRLSLQPLSNLEQLPDEHSRVAFSLLTLRSRLHAASGQQWYDLGPVLYRADKIGSLARSGWTLVRDMMELSRAEQRALGISLRDFSQTIFHACELFSLENPWRWRQGRHGHLLAGAYATLQTVVARQAQTAKGAERLHYEAQRLWYSCGALQAGAIEPTLHKMVELLQEFEKKSRHLEGVAQQTREQAAQLQHIGTAILHMLSGGGQPEVIRELYPKESNPIPRSVPRAIRCAADMGIEPELPSALFHNAFQNYASIMEKIQRSRTSQIPVDDKIIQLRQWLLELQQARRSVFAPHHEEKVLDLLYCRAIEQAESFANQLQGSARLDVQLLTTSAVEHENNRLSFVAKNIGRVGAKSVEVRLFVTERFRLIESSSVKRLMEDIPPDADAQFEFNIRPVVDDDFPIRLNISYRDLRREAQPQQFEFLVHVTSLDRGPFQPKPNPYIYGVPLQDHQYFYGRRQELESLLNHLAGGRPQNVLLRGARRTGKTSLLYMVRAIIHDRQGGAGVRAWFDVHPEWYSLLDTLQPVLLDLQSFEQLERVLTPTIFYQSIIQGISDAWLRADHIDRLLSESHISTTQFEQALNRILKEHSVNRLVLLLDEFDIVDLITDKAFYAQLRHIISNVQSITWIIASAVGLYKQVRDYESPLFNVFKIIDLRRLDREAAKRLILDPWRQQDDGKPARRSNLQFTDDAVDIIIDETGSHPYFIQLLSSAIVEHVNNIARTNYVLPGMVYEVIEKIIAPRSAAYEHFAYLWDRANSMGKVILLQLLRLDAPPDKQQLWQSLCHRLNELEADFYSEWMANEYESSLQSLQIVEALTFDNRDRFVLGIPLFRRLLEKRNQRENLWTPAIQELRSDFEREASHG